MRNVISVFLVAITTWLFVCVYYLKFGISSITEFFVVFVSIGLLINLIYFVSSIVSMKRKMKKELDLDRERRLQENPHCEANQILFGKSKNEQL